MYINLIDLCLYLYIYVYIHVFISLLRVLSLIGLVDVTLHGVAGAHRRHLPRIAFLHAPLEGLRIRR